MDTSTPLLLTLLHRTRLLPLLPALPLLLGGCAERFFFVPNQRVYVTPAQLGVQAEEHWIESEDGARLHALWLPVPEGVPLRGTVLHVHGNGANLTNHLPLVAWLPAAGFQVLTFDYRGYGRSEGSPSIDGVVADTHHALAWLRGRIRNQPQAAGRGIVVIGQSLGGATAIRAVATDPDDVRLLIADSAFASYRGITADIAERLGAPLSWLVRANAVLLPGRRSDPVDAAAQLRVPLLLIHGTADGVIPYHHGEELYEAAPTPKGFVRIDGGQHIDALMRRAVREQLLHRINALLPE